MEEISRIIAYLGKALDRAVVREEPTREIEIAYESAVNLKSGMLNYKIDAYE